MVAGIVPGYRVFINFSDEKSASEIAGYVSVGCMFGDYFQAAGTDIKEAFLLSFATANSETPCPKILDVPTASASSEKSRAS